VSDDLIGKTLNPDAPETKVPALPTLANADALLAAIKELLEVREGVRGNPLDSSVTWRDLLRSGVASLVVNGRLVSRANRSSPIVPTEPEVDLSPPPQPAGVIATGGYETVLIGWNEPGYKNHGYAEIFRSESSDFSGAIKVGQAAGTLFTDRPGLNVTRWYWVRFVSQADVAGQFNALEGTPATTGLDVPSTLEALIGQVGPEQLDAALGGRYAVKVDENGYISGYGLLVDTNEADPASTFVVRADRLVVANPGGPDIEPVIPFIVQTTPTTVNGVSVPAGVYMDGAYIQNGTITNVKVANASIDDAKIVNVAVDKLTAGDIGVGQFIQSTNYVPGQSGWRISGDGTAELNTVSARGDINAVSGTITGAVIVGSLIQTAPSGQRIQLDSQGFLFLTGASAGKYGTFKYGAKKYGDGVLVYLNNQTKKVPFYVNSEQNVADIHLYSRGADPVGATYEPGDMICVNGRLKIYVPALGGWKTVALEP
jgi:hypothetical protein